MDKYEEALAKARAEYEKARKQGYTWLMDLLEGMFPVLKESEDERVRRTLVEYFGPGVQLDFVKGVPIQKIRDWLEKQKDKRELDFAEGKVEGVKQTCQEIKDAMSLFEPKDLTPFEFTFRDYIDSAIRYCLSGEGYQQYIKEWAADLLNLERQKEQKPAEWSEEDEDMRYKATAILNKLCASKKEFVWQPETLVKIFYWLKSLRPPQYCENCKLKRSVENWKPGKEQMGMLLAVINDPNNAGAESCHLMLQSLYADLEKL